MLGVAFAVSPPTPELTPALGAYARWRENRILSITRPLVLRLTALDPEKKKFDVEEDGFKRRVKSVKVSSFTIEEIFRNQ